MVRMYTEVDNEIVQSMRHLYSYDLCNFKTKLPIATRPNPQEPPLEAQQNDTKHNSIIM